MSLYYLKGGPFDGWCVHRPDDMPGVLHMLLGTLGKSVPFLVPNDGPVAIYEKSGYEYNYVGSNP